MKKELIVGFDENNAKYIRTGTLTVGTSNESLLSDLISRSGTDWTGHIEKLEKAIIGMFRRNPGEKNYLKDMIGEGAFDKLVEYYRDTAIKTRTEEEKCALITKIIRNEY